jgi:NAD+ kinase
MRAAGERVVRAAAVLTHRRPDETRPALGRLLELARVAGVTLRFDPEETRKHSLSPATGLELDCASQALADVGLCFALGGDGTMLTALRSYAGAGVPVFGVNFGEIGFLAAVEREQAEEGFVRALAGQFEMVAMPGIEVSDGHQSWIAMNDVSIHRRQGMRVADLGYSIGDGEVGRVRCDGLVIATPTGSTGYNLANGGPVMAWGVEGYAVSFIAPHSLTARALVVAPADVLSVHNRSHEEPVDLTADGRPVGEIAAGAGVQTRFRDGQGVLAQLPGTTFYGRLREKFGRLATTP